MMIKVYTNGYGSYKGKCMSVFVHILKGKYDAGLKSPFVGEVAVTLLNQVEDKDHCTKTLKFASSAKKYALALFNFPVGKYLKDDTWYFRVSVDTANHDHKPWLECRLK